MTKAKDNHSGTVKKSVTINASQRKVWQKISNIVGLPEWVVNVKKTVFLSKRKRGVGAIRDITFDDGNTIEEHVVGWKNESYFSYIAVNGLPLRCYHATLTIKPKSKNTVQLFWESYFNSELMTKDEFSDFVKFMGGFYAKSLRNLKRTLE